MSWSMTALEKLARKKEEKRGLVESVSGSVPVRTYRYARTDGSYVRCTGILYSLKNCPWAGSEDRPIWGFFPLLVQIVRKYFRI
jgi:hypothetical protein